MGAIYMTRLRPLGLFITWYMLSAMHRWLPSDHVWAGDKKPSRAAWIRNGTDVNAVIGITLAAHCLIVAITLPLILRAR
jgi:hypothetical protein